MMIGSSFDMTYASYWGGFDLDLDAALQVEALDEALHVSDRGGGRLAGDEEAVDLESCRGGDDDAVYLVPALEEEGAVVADVEVGVVEEGELVEVRHYLGGVLDGVDAELWAEAMGGLAWT